MTWNRFENVSSDNPMPVQEVSGTYNAKEPISATNPLPVMEVEGSYSNYENVSSTNPQPVAIIADSGTYTRYEEYSDTNAFPVKFITGQTYDPRIDVSETNPCPVLVVSGDEEAYTTGAVHFDGATWMSIASLLAGTGLRTLSASFWIRTAALNENPYAPVFITDPEGVYENYLPIEFDNPVDNIYFTTGGPLSIEFPHTFDTPIPTTTWVNVLVSCDTNFVTPQEDIILDLPSQKPGHLYFNDVNANTSGVHEGGNGAIFDVRFNGLPFFVGTDTFGSNLLADISDLWVAPGQYIDFSIESNRRKFIDALGKPVDLGADGSTPTGTAPAVFVRRAPAAAATTFANNLGTGGTPFTITGTLTNAGTSPSD